MLARGCSGALASVVAPSALAARREAAAFSACRLASDLPNCSMFPATSPPSDLFNDVWDAARCSGSIIPTPVVSRQFSRPDFVASTLQALRLAATATSGLRSDYSVPISTTCFAQAREGRLAESRQARNDGAARALLFSVWRERTIGSLTQSFQSSNTDGTEDFVLCEYGGAPEIKNVPEELGV